MIRISQLKLPINHTQDEMYDKVAKQLKISKANIKEIVIIKQSVDARKKPVLSYSYTLDIKTDMEQKVLHRAKGLEMKLVQEEGYRLPKNGTEILKHPPIIVGSGPAGLFCAYLLAKNGYCPILLERGEAVDQRMSKVLSFWNGSQLDLQSNVQFGEGGAGTFSDGKLNTLVKDSHCRNKKVLEIFVEFGAESSILYKNKPHLGTDQLSNLVKRIRNEIIACGGSVHFSSQVTDILVEDQQITGVVVNGQERYLSNTVVLAIGHSARDTFKILDQKGIAMQAKAFAVGLRIQHPQSVINRSQYGADLIPELGAANYKLTKQTSTGRGVYSFCMCPGGYVVDASSEHQHLAVNGMSYHDQAGTNANSAIIATITPDDFVQDTALDGIEYQRQLEAVAYQLGGGNIPIQLYEDFKRGRVSTQLGSINAEFKGKYQFSNLHSLFSPVLFHSLVEGIEHFGKMIQGFDAPDAVLAGVESRTSSPVRIIRDEKMESVTVRGLYPCGEGAGYAGGITSAAMDGIKTAEVLIQKYKPLTS